MSSLGARDIWIKTRQHPLQLFLALVLVICCGAVLKFQLAPMNWIADVSACRKLVTKIPSAVSPVTAGNKIYQPKTWEETTTNCKEKAEVFVFVGESWTISTAYFVFFGLTKAIFNFVTGVSCDRFGRKWTLVAGWVLAIAYPLMVIFATNWWTVAVSNIFLGMQQALVWSATIFIMIDYYGRGNSGIAVGINETVGYSTIAIVGVIATNIMDVEKPRTTCYYVVIALILLGFVISVFGMRESKPVAVQEEAADAVQEDEAALNSDLATLTWPSGRAVTFSKAQSAFVYTSFINGPLMSINFAGLMANFISGFAWGLFAKWMKADYLVGDTLMWAKLSKETIANITLGYDIPKGVLQWFFGYLGDRVGRRWLISGGLAMMTLGLIVIAATGQTQANPVGGFTAGAVLLGIGTAMMYSNAIAAVAEHTDPTWRSSAIGAYRFWRDLGFTIGALIMGGFADSVGIFGSVLITMGLTALSAICVGVFFREGQEASASRMAPPATKALEAPPKTESTEAAV